MTERRLAAILVADVVGCSKLVGSDEARTLTKLQTACGGYLIASGARCRVRAVREANAEQPLLFTSGIHPELLTWETA